jgi:RNA polymerase sigma-70 factor (ECF subfamily)
VGPALADDLAAETFTAAWASLDRFDCRSSSARPWILGIASNVIRRNLEAELRWQRAIDTPDHQVDHDVAEVEPKAIDPQLAQALARLAFDDREVLVLVALAELNASEVAKMLGISHVAARLRLHRARRRLISHLEEHST